MKDEIAAATLTVIEAIRNTPRDYMTSLLASRDAVTGIGSIFLKPTTKDTLLEAAWENYQHPNIAAPARGFICQNMSGYVGIIRIIDLPEPQEGEGLFLVPNSKKTGFVDAVWREKKGIARTSMPMVDFTVALIGPGDNGQDMIWTVHPGHPILPSTLKAEGDVEKAVTRDEAWAAGFEFAKVERI